MAVLSCFALNVTIQYNTNFIVNFPWGLFRDNRNNKKTKKYSNVIDKHLLRNYLHIKFMTLKIDLKRRLSFYV